MIYTGSLVAVILLFCVVPSNCQVMSRKRHTHKRRYNDSDEITDIDAVRSIDIDDNYMSNYTNVNGRDSNKHDADDDDDSHHSDSNLKRNKLVVTDVELVDRGILKAKKYTENFYVGEKKFEYSSVDNPGNRIFRYIRYCLSESHSFVSTIINEFDQYIPHIIAKLFVSALRFNGIKVGPMMQLNYVNNYIRFAEPGFYQYIDDRPSQIKLNLAMPVIMSVLADTETIHTTFSLETKNLSIDPALHDNLLRANYSTTSSALTQYIPSTYSGINVRSKMLKLLVIADHIATHYIEDYIRKPTDWLFHTSFGVGCGTTLHSTFLVTASTKQTETTTNDILNILSTVHSDSTGFCASSISGLFNV